MAFTFIRVIASGLRTAAAEVKSRDRARQFHFKAPMSFSSKSYSWIQGLCTGIGQAMANQVHDAHLSSLDGRPYPVVRFSAHTDGQALLLIEVVRSNAAGDEVLVTSTLNYTEALAVRAGIETLRHTGVFSINEQQATQLLECTNALKNGTPAKRSMAFA